MGASVSVTEDSKSKIKTKNAHKQHNYELEPGKSNEVIKNTRQDKMWLKTWKQGN